MYYLSNRCARKKNKNEKSFFGGYPTNINDLEYPKQLVSSVRKILVFMCILCVKFMEME